MTQPQFSLEETLNSLTLMDLRSFAMDNGIVYSRRSKDELVDGIKKHFEKNKLKRGGRENLIKYLESNIEKKATHRRNMQRTNELKKWARELKEGQTVDIYAKRYSFGDIGFDGNPTMNSTTHYGKAVIIESGKSPVIKISEIGSLEHLKGTKVHTEFRPRADAFTDPCYSGGDGITIKDPVFRPQRTDCL